MKKIIYALLLALISITLVGCTGQKANNDKEIYIGINCNGKEKRIGLDKNDKFKCTLMNTKYEFTLIKIEDDKITIKVNSEGLTPVRDDGTMSLLDKETKFIVYMDKELILSTQTTDYSEKLKINWK